MDFVIDSVEINANIVNKPEKAISTIRDIYDAIDNMRNTKDSWERMQWSIRDIGKNATYQQAIQEIAALVNIRLNKQAADSAQILRVIHDNLDDFKNQNIAVWNEVQLILNQVQRNNERVQLDYINRYGRCWLLNNKEYDKVMQGIKSGRECLIAETPVFVIILVNDDTKTKIRLTVYDDKTGLETFRIGRYLTDLTDRINGDVYDIPEQVQFKNIDEVIGCGVEINLNYMSDFDNMHYIIKYDKMGCFSSLDKTKFIQ